MVNVLIAITASVASIKLNELYKAIREKYENVKVISTELALHFISPNDNIPILTDRDEWTLWKQRGDPILHIELRNWADVLLIAPLDANTMAKIANGLCDNLLTCVIRAWSINEEINEKDDNGKNCDHVSGMKRMEMKRTKPIIACPAMNTNMWNHMITKEHLERLILFGFDIIYPMEKRLMCGDVGMGAMASIENILENMKLILIKNKLIN